MLVRRIVSNNGSRIRILSDALEWYAANPAFGESGATLKAGILSEAVNVEETGGCDNGTQGRDNNDGFAGTHGYAPKWVACFNSEARKIWLPF